MDEYINREDVLKCLEYNTIQKPKCLLFNCWLEEPYKKCEPCRRACAEVDGK